MIERLTSGKVTWIDVVMPTADDIRTLQKECKLPAPLTHDLTTKSPHSDITIEKDLFKIQLYYPVVKRTDITHSHDLKIIATKKHLITIRFEDIEVIHRFQKECEVSELLSTSPITSGSQFAFLLFDRLYQALNTKLDYLDARLNDATALVLARPNKESLVAISEISRRLISFRHALTGHRQIINELTHHTGSLVDKSHARLLDALHDDFAHCMHRADALQEATNDLRDTTSTLLTIQQNEVVKTLTIMAFITFPLTLFSSMFGMNTTTAPIIGREGDFWIIVFIMVCVSIGFFTFFHYKKWL